MEHFQAINGTGANNETQSNQLKGAQKAQNN